MTTRRQLIKLGLVGGAAAALTHRREARGGGSTLPPSPPTTPFLDRLPVPPPPREIDPHRSATIPPGFQDLSAACRAFIDPTGRLHANFFKIVTEVRKVKFHSQLPPTEIWGYRDGNLPPGQKWPFALGPTFIRTISSTANATPDERFRPTIVRFTNELPSVADHTGFGEPRTTVHLHGGHHPSFTDGFPANILLPDGTPFNPVFARGEHFDYCYPMLDPGFLSELDGSKGVREPTARPSTLWYHDHLLDFTGQNVYRGLAGFYLVFDPHDPATARDTGDETNAANLPFALRLPSGAFDIPMVFQEKTFAADGSLAFDEFNFDGFLGDKSVVNGVVQPYLPVKQRKYRFRFLNGSNARIYQLYLTDQRGRSYPMTQIATEGGLLSRSIERPGVMLAMAERIEVVIDFNQFPQGTELFLENRLAQDEGRGPRGTFEEPELLANGTRLVKFIVGEQVPDPSRVPTELRPFASTPASEIAQATRRTFVFERRHGLWTVNGQVANPAVTNATVSRDTPEIWSLVNKSGGWWHPVHIHAEFARVLTRNGRIPFGGTGRDYGQGVEQDGVSRKDTLLLGPNSEVEVFLTFRDYQGPYVFHCHNLEHEDHAMMGRFDVGPKR